MDPCFRLKKFKKKYEQQIFMIFLYNVLMNDGICDDKSNTYQCNFDGGDCCKDDTIKDFCLLCQCFST